MCTNGICICASGFVGDRCQTGTELESYKTKSYIKHVLTTFQYAMNIYLKACDDTRDWNNNAGGDCGYYAKNVCHNGQVIPGQETLLGKVYNYPENSCCSCRKHGNSFILF